MTVSTAGRDEVQHGGSDVKLPACPNHHRAGQSQMGVLGQRCMLNHPGKHERPIT